MVKHTVANTRINISEFAPEKAKQIIEIKKKKRKVQLDEPSINQFENISDDELA